MPCLEAMQPPNRRQSQKRMAQPHPKRSSGNARLRLRLQESKGRPKRTKLRHRGRGHDTQRGTLPLSTTTATRWRRRRARKTARLRNRKNGVPGRASRPRGPGTKELKMTEARETAKGGRDRSLRKMRRIGQSITANFAWRSSPKTCASARSSAGTTSC